MPHSLRHAPWLYLVLLMLVAVGLYLPGLFGPFVFDDLPNLVENQTLFISGQWLDDWRTAAFGSGGGGPLRRPLSMFSFALNHVAQGGLSPLGIKATNLCIHLLVGALLFAAYRQLGEAPALAVCESRLWRQVAILAVALWLLHPLHVSTVLYAVQRMAQLSALFVVAGIVVFLRYRNRWVLQRPCPGELVAAGTWLVLLTLLAGLSKENGLLLPVLVLVIELTLYRGVVAGKRSRFWVRVTQAIVLAAGLIGMALVCYYQPTFELLYEQRPFSLSERLMTQLRVLWLYVSWLVYPDVAHLGTHHDDVELSLSWLQPATTLVALCAWAGLGVVAFFSRRRLPLLAFGASFFLVAHVMESTFIPLEMIYEHRNYLASAGVCLLLAYLVLAGAQKLSSEYWRVFVLAPLVLWALMLHLRAMEWSNNDVMTLAAVENHPRSPRAHFFRGEQYLLEHGRSVARGDDLTSQAAWVGLAREQFQHMAVLDPRDVAGPVLLYIVESTYFPQLAAERDWLVELAQTFERAGVMQASDRAALNALADCLLSQVCKASQAQITAFFGQLRSAYPDDAGVLRAHYKMSLRDPALLDVRLELLARMLAVAPTNAAFHYYRISEYSRVSDVAGMYGAVSQWFAADQPRHNLSMIHRLFDLEGKP